jgi:hypothetical protein
MTRTSATLAGVLALALVASARFAAAQPGGVTGSVSFGTRSVDLEGTDAKFREDVNLASGVRLFDARLRYERGNTATDAAVDRIELDATGLGGEPFESVHFAVRKHGAYSFRADRRRSEFFYDDTILPAALASVAGSTGGDFHRFDFERVRDSADLEIDLTPATQLSLGLERQTRTGGSTTTITAERDEFELERPLDESLNALTFGVRHAWRRVTLVAAEELRDVSNTSELVLPGASPGHNLTDLASLSFFTRDESYDYSSRGHSLRLLASPTERLDLSAAWRREELDLDAAANERATGITFAGAPFDTTAAGASALDRSIEIDELTVGFAASPRVRVVGNARHSTLDQDGDAAVAATAGASAWHFATDGLEAGVEVAVTSALTVAAGWSAESRDADYDWTLAPAAAARTRTTERDGYFARLAFTVSGGWQLNASLEDNSIDAPYALAAATASRRYRIGARRRWGNGLSLSANYRNTDVENDESGWLADTEQADLRLLYRRERLEVSAGYARIELERSIDQLVMAGTRPVPYVIDYATAAMLRDASVRRQLNERFTVGGDLRTYDTHGSVRVARDDLRAYGEIALGAGYALQLAYRDIDYAEDAFDAYDARMLELALRLAW